MARKPTSTRTEVDSFEEEETTVAPKPEKPAKPKVMATHEFGLYEPDMKIYFRHNQPVEVYEITSWMRCQIDAGLLRVIE